jgi:protein TonB
MSHIGTVAPSPPRLAGRSELGSPAPFPSLVLTQAETLAGRKSATLFISVVLHSMLVVAVAILPLLFYDALPAQDALKAFFVAPLEIAPPPPPPPPPPASVRAVTRVAPKVAAQPTQGFVAPAQVPDEIRPGDELDLGIDGGVPGGVEGGVPGGVFGGVVSGLPAEAPTPPKVVRVGGQIKEPKKIRHVAPVYPDLAMRAHVDAMVILEAEVDTHGEVRSVNVLRGHPLFDAAVVDAVKQWRYQPLLLNGVPTAFVVTVTFSFNLQQQPR